MVAFRGSQQRFAANPRTASEGTSQARDYLGRGYEKAEYVVVHNPMSSVLVMFGVGLGVGILLALAMASRQRSFSELSTTEKAQWLGRRVRDTMTQALPEAVTRHWHR